MVTCQNFGLELKNVASSFSIPIENVGDPRQEEGEQLVRLVLNTVSFIPILQVLHSSNHRKMIP